MKKNYIFIGTAVFLMLISTESSVINTVLYSGAIVPLAIVLGELTSVISDKIGEKKGGLLTAALGNIPELMMGIWSVKYGMVSMVKSALVGSIISNMLLVLGVSVFLGGIKYREQIFNKIVARTNFSMLFLAMTSMIVVASLKKYSKLTGSGILYLSVGIAVVLITVYILGLVFSLYTHRNLFVVSENSYSESACEKIKESSMGYFNIVLSIVISAVLMYFISEKLILNTKQMVNKYNVSEEFLGIILIPLLGNIGENLSAIVCALKDRVNLSLEIAIGSSIQIALFVTPLLMIYSFIRGVSMTFLFTDFQIIMSLVAGGMSFFVFQDGKTYWLEGAILIAIYIVITLAYYFIA